MPVCPFCKTDNTKDAKHCQSCGKNLQPPQRTLCRKCGTAIRVGDSFCRKCGTPLTIAGSMESREPDAQKSTKPFPPASQPPPDSFPEELNGSAPPQKNQIAPTEQAKQKTRAKTQLIPTQEIIRMANAIGIDIDYNTLRFWQKRGLIPNPTRGPLDTGRGTRGYYDARLVDRIAFIRAVQKGHSMGLDAIREELERIDLLVVQRNDGHPSDLYQERLVELRTQRDVEARRTLLSMLSKSLGIDPEEIATIVVRKKDGQTIRFLPGRMLNETDR